MHLTLNDFCLIVRSVELSNRDAALAILWFHDLKEPDVVISARALAKTIYETGVGNPNPTNLAVQIKNSGMVLPMSDGFRLKHASRDTIRGWLPALVGVQPPLDHSSGYLPDAIWSSTRSYIEDVCKQMNGCFSSSYYDACSVMLRRLFETLIIECYESLGRQQDIKGADGNYLMLRDLADRAISAQGLNLGRDAKTTIKRVKEQGDRSAHNRRFVAVAVDLTEIQSGVRLATQELIQIAKLKHR